MTEAIPHATLHQDETSRLLRSLAYIDRAVSDLQVSTLAGRQMYAQEVSEVFTFLKMVYAENRSVRSEITGIHEALEGWREYQAPSREVERKKRSGWM